MARRDIVVIGGSAGGIAPLQTILATLPADFAAAVLVVIHVPSYSPSRLPEMLSRCTPLRVSHAREGDAIEHGRVYVAPPDRHLILDDDRVLVRKGPRENRFRPSVDALFRSAAYVYGSRVIGVVLSGALDDGTSGMWAICHRGGTSIVQQPSDAEHDGMPASVLEHVDADHTVPASEIGALLQRIVGRNARKVATSKGPVNVLAKMEIAIAKGHDAFEAGVLEVGMLTPLTCPECHGALVRLKEGRIDRYRCHTGHAYTANTLLASVTESIEETLWQSMKSLEEAAMLLNHLGEHAVGDGDQAAADLFHRKAHETAGRARRLHQLIAQHQQTSADEVLHAAAAPGSQGTAARAKRADVVVRTRTNGS